jgi:hypothetical protein
MLQGRHRVQALRGLERHHEQPRVHRARSCAASCGRAETIEDLAAHHGSITEHSKEGGRVIAGWLALLMVWAWFALAQFAAYIRRPLDAQGAVLRVCVGAGRGPAPGLPALSPAGGVPFLIAPVWHFGPERQGDTPPIRPPPTDAARHDASPVRLQPLPPRRSTCFLVPRRRHPSARLACPHAESSPNQGASLSTRPRRCSRSGRSPRGPWTTTARVPSRGGHLNILRGNCRSGRLRSGWYRERCRVVAEAGSAAPAAAGLTFATSSN